MLSCQGKPLVLKSGLEVGKGLQQATDQLLASLTSVET